MMRHYDKLLENIEQELDNIAEKGLSASNLEHAYKLIDMRKDLMEDAESGGYSGEYSGRRQHRDSMGRYARNSYGDDRYSGTYSGNGYSYGGHGNSFAAAADDQHERYMNAKRSYRSNHSGDCKQRVIDSLEDYMEQFKQHMEELARDADCAEERDTINKYIRKIESVTR